MAVQRTVRHIVLALLFSLACAGTVQAGDASGGESAGQRPSASASVGFRIVVREVLRLDDQAPRLNATAPQTTRTVTALSDRNLVTLARP